MLLLFIETYADLAVRLDANIEDADIDDDAAIQALMEGTAQGTAPSAPSAPSERPKSASPKSKGKKKVDDHVICGIPESAGQNLVPDVVLELEESEMANKRGHVVIAIENPNPDLDIKILVRRGGGLEFAAVDFTVNLCCFLVSSNMTNHVDGNTSYPPSKMKDYVYCDQAKQTFNQMCFFSL